MLIEALAYSSEQTLGAIYEEQEEIERRERVRDNCDRPTKAEKLSHAVRLDIVNRMKLCTNGRYQCGAQCISLDQPCHEHKDGRVKKTSKSGCPCGYHECSPYCCPN